MAKAKAVRMTLLQLVVGLLHVVCVDLTVCSSRDSTRYRRVDWRFLALERYITHYHCDPLDNPALCKDGIRGDYQRGSGMSDVMPVKQSMQHYVPPQQHLNSSRDETSRI